MKNEKLINDFKLLNEDSKKDFIKIVKNIENGTSLEKISIQFDGLLNNAHKNNNIFTKGEYKVFLKELLMNCLEKNQDTVNMINHSLKDDFYNDKLYYDLEKIAGGDFHEAYDFIINNAIIKVEDDTNSDSDEKFYKLGIPFRYNGKYYEKDQYFSITFPKDIKDNHLNLVPVSTAKIEALGFKTFTDRGTLDTFESPKLSDLKSKLEINVLNESTKYNEAENIMRKIEEIIKVKFAFSLINNSDLKLSPNLEAQKEEFEKKLNIAIEKVSLDANVYNTILSAKKDIVISKSYKASPSLQKSIECFRDNSIPFYKKIEENFEKIYKSYVELNRNDLLEKNHGDYAKYNTLVEVEKEKKEIEKIFDIENENDYDSAE